MNSKYAGSMGFQRLIKTIKSAGGGGGGAPTADSIDGSHIIDEAITNDDIANGTLTFNKLHSDLLSAIAGQIAVFELTNDATSSAAFSARLRYDNPDEDPANSDDDYIIIFSGERVEIGETKYIACVLPTNFAPKQFQLIISGPDSYIEIDQISASLANPDNGIMNANVAGTNIITFDIARGHQNYLEMVVVVVSP
jgi:hypothetical protein